MKKTILKIFKYTIILLLVGIVSTFVWADYELNKIWGKSTEVINISSFIKPTPTIQIRNVNIISEDCSHFIKNQNVLIKDGKIVSIDSIEIINNTAKIIDGTNKYLIAGLVDSHVHLKKSKNDLYLYLINGVTSIREMAGKPIVLDWKKAIQEGNEIGPRMFVTSPSISSVSGLKGYYHSWTRNTINYTTKEDAEKAIKKIKQQGYNAIKMYGFVNPEIFKATIEIAKKNNIPVIGHIPEVNLNTFYNSGQIEIAHIEEITKKIIEEFGKSLTKNHSSFIEFLEMRADQVAVKLKNKNLYVTTTVALMKSLPEQKFNLDTALKTVKLKYVNPKIVEGTSIAKLGWLPTKNGYEEDGLDDLEYKEELKYFWEIYDNAIKIMTKHLLKHNVQLLVGTDANVSVMVPGFSLHEELSTLVDYGMTNSQVLYAATVAPNEFIKNNSGKIKVGYNSDLVLLSKNPLVDIQNTKTIEYVFFDQYMIDNNQTQDILKAIEDANNKYRTIEITDFIN